MDALPRLLALAAEQTGCLLNISSLAAPFQQSRQTIREYITLLSMMFLLDELPPWHINRSKRLVKTPKLHIGDSGLICALTGLETDALWDNRSQFGRLLESWIYQELRRHASWHEQDNFRSGVLLYDGEATLGFGDRLFAVPISRLWG